MALPKSAPNRYTTSRQLIAGSDINGMNDQLYSAQSITAGTVQTQAGATQINAAAVFVTTGNANDGVILPPGYAGLEIFVASNANTLKVYPSGTETIGNGAAGVAYAQTAKRSAIYKCIVGPTATTQAQWSPNVSGVDA